MIHRSETSRWRPKVTSFLAAVALTGVVIGVGYTLWSQQRDMVALQQRVARINSDSSAEVVELNDANVDRAVMNENVYTTVLLDDGTVSAGTILEGRVVDGALTSDTSIRMPNGGVVLAQTATDNTYENWTLPDGSVTNAKLVNSAVTSLKLSNGSVTNLKIRDGAITKSKIAQGQIQAVHLSTGSVLTAKIAKAAVTNAKIAPAAISNSKIGDRAISTSKLAAQSVTTAKIAFMAVDNERLADGSVGPTNIIDGSVTTSKLANGAVTTIKLADLAVTAAKIATGTITGAKIASDGSVVKSISGNSIISVTNNGNGSYSLALTLACGDQQILKFVSGQWQCANDAGFTTPQDIFRFPYVGQQKTDWFDNSPEAIANHGGVTPNYLIYLGAGQSGVVRSVFFVGSNALTDWTDMDDYELRIYTGAGDLSAAQRLNPPSQYLDAQIPLGPLLGAVYNQNRSTETPVETAILDYGRSQDAAVTLNLPIPFENGILMQVWKKSPAAPDTTHIAYHWVSYETGTSDFPYQSWRLKASAVSHQLVTDENGITFMDVNDKAGMLVGLYSSIRSVAGLAEDFNEMNWTFFPDGETDPDWQVSGTEDLFGINPYYYSQGVETHDNWGTTYADVGTAAYENYRLFVRDPILWQSSLRGFYPTTGESQLDVNIVTLYYAEK